MLKRFTVSLIAVLSVTGCLMARGVQEPSRLLEKPVDQKFKMREALIREKADALVAGQNPAETRAPQIQTPVVYDAVGTYKYYDKDSKGIDFYQPYEEKDLAATVVFGDDNKVYFKDILSLYRYYSFITGVMDDEGVITVPLPQTVDYNLTGLPLNICLFEKAPAGSEEPYIVSDIQYVEFIYDKEADTITLNLPGEEQDYLLGLTIALGDGWFLGDGEYAMEFKPTYYDTNISQMPEGVPEVMYMFREGDTGYPVYVAEVGNSLYIRGLSELFPYGVIRATVNDNIATIRQMQIVGTDYGWWAYIRLIQFAGMNQGQEMWEWVTDNKVTYDLQIDRTNNVITCLTGYMDEYILVLTAPLPVEDYYYEEFDNFTISLPDLEGTPEDPEDIAVIDFGNMYQIGVVIPTVSTDDNLLDVSSLYYRIYIDGDVWEFEPDPSEGIYLGLDGPTTEIPFNLTNGVDINSAYYNMRFVWIYATGATEFGVQSVYKYGGTVTESQIVSTTETTDFDDSGVDSVGSDIVVTQNYYDLNGRKVTTPGKGLYIVKKTMGDGTVKSSKIMVK